MVTCKQPAQSIVAARKLSLADGAQNTGCAGGTMELQTSSPHTTCPSRNVSGRRSIVLGHVGRGLQHVEVMATEHFKLGGGRSVRIATATSSITARFRPEWWSCIRATDLYASIRNTCLSGLALKMPLTQHGKHGDLAVLITPRPNSQRAKSSTCVHATPVVGLPTRYLLSNMASASRWLAPSLLGKRGSTSSGAFA